MSRVFDLPGENDYRGLQASNRSTFKSFQVAIYNIDQLQRKLLLSACHEGLTVEAGLPALATAPGFGPNYAILGIGFSTG